METKYSKFLLIRKDLTIQYSKVVNMYIVYELDKWWSNLKQNVATKSCFLVAVILTRSAVKRDSIFTMVME